VREHDVVRRADRGAPVGHPGRLDAKAVPEEGRDPGLVVGDPVLDDVPERVEHELRVFREALDDVA
jgi:hypothetical protein